MQGRLLALLYLHPEVEYSITDAAAGTGASVKAAHQEISRLVEAGLLTDRRAGTSRLVRAAVDSPLARPLTDLLALTYGPLPVLTTALSGLRGAETAYIYGSWAARYNGEPGPPPADVDVIVVGDVDVDDLDERARRAEKILRREVNVRRVRPETWADGTDPFVSTVRARPKVAVPLDEQEQVDA
ncbi:winged helix-turn-helix domain-containing protein [Cellulomonas persica]|uniref:winged helix-turn-helix domain-containing protein n=1 Tax=Cellulomonas persica TaxID=76861 RepID=UPI001C99B89D|nr:winged helix-turn-helix domain-containing protein [Cellulomonas persica]